MNDNIRFSDLTRLVRPDSIALVGASDRGESIGGRTLENLTKFSTFVGRLYLVNPSRTEIGGVKCYPSVCDLPEAPDVAIVVVKAEAVLAVIQECGKRGVKFAIVLTSGFGELGEAGKEMERQMQRVVAETGMRIYGPNCPGLNNINARLGMTFSPAFRLDLVAGPIGVATQGGGLGRTFLQAMERGIGTGLWCSGGNEVDLEVSDFINYMADAPDIKVIATLIEGVRNGPKFMEACLNAAKNGKPVVALKIGRSEYGMKAAQSHTAAITGSAEVNSAVLRELGVIEVNDVDELIDTAALFSRRIATGDEKLAIFCFSGGTAALAADHVGAAGLTLAQFDPRTRAALASTLPAYAAVDNPVDTTADVLSKEGVAYHALVNVCADPNVDVVLYPIPLEYGQVTARAGADAALIQSSTDRTIVPVWMSDRLGQGYDWLVDGGMMPIRSVGRAVAVLQRFVQYGKWRRSFDADWTPSALIPNAMSRTEGSGLTMLNEVSAKALLSDGGLKIPTSVVVATSHEAATAFGKLNSSRAVLKIVSAKIAHKTEIGGVCLNINSPEKAAEAHDAIRESVSAHMVDEDIDGVLVEAAVEGKFIEVVIGVQRDPTFGYLCTFGLGGVSIELFKDVSRRLLPLSRKSARDMIAETKCSALLAGFRGDVRYDVEALIDTLLLISDLVTRGKPVIDQLEINPLAVLAEGRGAVVLDALLSIQDETQSIDL